MNWTDLELIWKQQEAPGAMPADSAALRHRLEARRRKIAQTLFWRDVKGGTILLGISAYLAYKGWRLNWPLGPLALGILPMVAVAGVFIWERLRLRGLNVGMDATLLARLVAERDELRHQRRLMLNVGKWFVAPLLFSFGILWHTGFGQKPGLWQEHSPLFWGGYGVFCVFACVLTVIINRRYVRTTIDPQLAELEQLHARQFSTR